MSGTDIEQASGDRNRDPPFGQSPAPNHARIHNPSPSFDASPTAASVSPSAPPPISTYSPPPSGTFDYQTRSASANHPSVTKRQQRHSPEPDEYYRQRGSSAAVPGAGDATNGVNMDPTAYPSAVDKVSPSPASVLGPSRTRPLAYRTASASDSPTLGSSSNRAHPHAASIARSRKTSFKDLINKFNNASDEVLPLPSATQSREASRAASPTASFDGPERPRALPRRQNVHDPTQSITSAPLSPLEPRGNLLPAPLHSSTAIPPPLFNRIPESHPRRALYGELLSINTQVQNSLSGIPSHLRRRGSDGSIASPNPAFVDNPESAISGRSPLTPTAWYLGQTTSLEAVQPGFKSHRRARSDLAVNTAIAPLADPWNPHMAVPASLQQGKPGNVSPGSPNSKSRIPVSANRVNSAFGLESPSPTSNPTFSSRSASIPVPPKGTSRLPKPSPKNSPPRMTEDVPTSPTSFAITSRGRRDLTIGRSRTQVPERSQLLQAYIAAPPPKKSPTLRSSRRQFVSNGSPTSPRSRVGDTLSTFQRYNTVHESGPRSRPRQRQIPELGNVDFETRRQRIQQAFNRTVQENERKEEAAAELRRQARAKFQKHEAAQSPTTDNTATPTTTKQPERQPQGEMTTTVEEPAGAVGEGEKENRAPPHVKFDTSPPAPEKDARRTAMDSPTLGLPHERPPAQQESHPEGTASPGSAAGSEDTHVTTFDPEPQSGLAQPAGSGSHRTLFNHIMQIRESSSSDSSCDEAECSLSEADDKESIQVMLQKSTYFDSSSSTDTQEPQAVLMQQAQAGDTVPNRWSMSSWSSSGPNHTAFDETCDESSDDLPLQRPSSGHTNEATAQSCSAASTRPPSVVVDESSTSPVQDHGVLGPQTLSGSSGQQWTPFLSTPPSLAKKGRWDSKRVTALYLKELTRGPSQNIPLPQFRAPPEPPRSADSTNPRNDGRNDSLTGDPVLVPRIEDIPISERLTHSASLVGREDWLHASPSIMDWMQVAAEDEAITPSNDRPAFMPDIATVADPDGSHNQGAGLGLSINVQAPTSMPPEFQPAPGGISTGNESAPDHAAMKHHSTGSSEDSSLRHLEPTPSPQAADSSVTSLVPSTEQPPRAEASKSPSPEQRRLRKRRHVIKELVDTEYTFGRDMKVVDDIYKGTSSSCLDLSADDVKILFANSEQIVQFSISFQDALKTAARSVYVMPKSQRWGSKRSAYNGSSTAEGPEEPSAIHTAKSDLEKDRSTFIGQAFIAHLNSMEKVYSDYLRNHDAANKKLQALQRNPKVAIWLKECRDWAADLTTAWDLDSLLVKPVQRILKYPLLLNELLESTPTDHPDRAALASALQEVTNVSVRINEMKKRADLVGQVVGRKRKESDVRAGLSKAFGRRTEKFKQNVGLTDLFEDKEYDSLAMRFGDGYFQLQLVMRDVEEYINEIQNFMARFNEIAASMEAVVDASPSNYAELEVKWRRFKKTVWDIITTALPEHLDVIRKSVISPMVTLIKLHDGPQKVMKKRNKRLVDYAKFKAVKDRGDKPDKKMTEQGEQFMALNDTLKDELPKLYNLTAKLAETCLKNFIQIQTTWWNLVRKQIEPHVETFPDDLQKIISDWSNDYSFAEAQVLSLGICNGSSAADTVNLLNFNAPGSALNSPSRPSNSSARPGSFVDESSPKVSHDYSIPSTFFQSPQMDSGQSTKSRHRTNSSMSGRAVPSSQELHRSQMLQQVTNNPSATSPSQGTRATVGQTESFPSLPMLSLDTPFLADILSGTPDENNPATSPAGRYSGFFSSAMPMSDATDSQPVEQSSAVAPPKVLFLAASIYEFNIDRARREAGYPYLTYVAGEIFDVIGEKGELWLARNQDDSTGQVGWIWNKHFAKLST
ncbi:hypothetical protein N7510_006116 [Penicillium lagena]|uniref:uncharacterized protein n=1 Tax=Penicillium lagena TaxID=94218 RepID=UPI002541442D|nr:uncharacterized protein N7510_006116 [Penicillium lagena]KAJ5612922.1 hypothetical protein N7510_006116 [Penicillium lagena]